MRKREQAKREGGESGTRLPGTFAPGGRQSAEHFRRAFGEQWRQTIHLLYLKTTVRMECGREGDPTQRLGFLGIYVWENRAEVYMKIKTTAIFAVNSCYAQNIVIVRYIWWKFKFLTTLLSTANGTTTAETYTQVFSASLVPSAAFPFTLISMTFVGLLVTMSLSCWFDYLLNWIKTSIFNYHFLLIDVFLNEFQTDENKNSNYGWTHCICVCAFFAELTAFRMQNFSFFSFFFAYGDCLSNGQFIEFFVCH
jgi:hypothetical protein